jgi:hypothetical protein
MAQRRAPRGRAFFLVLEREVLVREALPVNGLAAGSVKVLEVARLAHEVGQHAVENAALEV